MSKPRSLRRWTRSVMRQRSSRVEKSRLPVSARPQLAVAPTTMPSAMSTGSTSVLQQAAGLEVHELAGDVDAGDLEVVLALAVA